MSQPQLVRTARCFFETFRQRWVTVTTTGNSFHRNYVPHGRGSSFADKFGNTYKPGYFGKYYEKAHKSMYPDLLIHKDIISIRRGNRDLLYTHDVSIAEIEYRQCFRSAYDDDLYVEDQSDSLYVIDTF